MWKVVKRLFQEMEWTPKTSRCQCESVFLWQDKKRKLKIYILEEKEGGKAMVRVSEEIPIFTLVSAVWWRAISNHSFWAWICLEIEIA